MRRWIPMATVVVVGLVISAGCGGSDSGSSTDSGDSGALAGTVGPGFDISMDKTETPAGTYTITVDDKAADHNFHLTGPGGVDVATDVAEVGTKTFEVDLEAGTYTFVCDPHASSMTGTLTVT